CSAPTYVKPRFGTSRRRQLSPCKLANTEIQRPRPQRDIQKKSRLVVIGSLNSQCVRAFRLGWRRRATRESQRHATGCDGLRCRCVLTCLVESKPNSTMIKTNTISVVLMASSIIDKKSPKPP